VGYGVGDTPERAEDAHEPMLSISAALGKTYNPEWWDSSSVVVRR
jgi:hypothetical protein